MKVDLQYFGGRGASSRGGRSSGGIPKKWDTHEKRIIAMEDLRKEKVNLAKQALKMTLNKSGSKSEIAKIRKKRDKVGKELEKVRNLHNRIEKENHRKAIAKMGFKSEKEYKEYTAERTQRAWAATQNYSKAALQKERKWNEYSKKGWTGRGVATSSKEVKKFYGG